MKSCTFYIAPRSAGVRTLAAIAPTARHEVEMQGRHPDVVLPVGSLSAKRPGRSDDVDPRDPESGVP